LKKCDIILYVKARTLHFCFGFASGFSAVGKEGLDMFEKKIEISYLLDYYGEVLTDKQRDAIDLYYNEDFSLAEISDYFGITRQGVRDAIKRGEEMLLDLEEKLGFLKRLEEYKEAFEIINECAKNIKFSKSNMNFYKILDENIDLVIEITEKLTVTI
jgi:predicted DNA-binding protein YlxM (UPF0122 family)